MEGFMLLHFLCFFFFLLRLFSNHIGFVSAWSKAFTTRQVSSLLYFSSSPHFPVHSRQRRLLNSCSFFLFLPSMHQSTQNFFSTRFLLRSQLILLLVSLQLPRDRGGPSISSVLRLLFSNLYLFFLFNSRSFSRQTVGRRGETKKHFFSSSVFVSFLTAFLIFQVETQAPKREIP